MNGKLASLAAIAVVLSLSLAPRLAQAQEDEIYDFDGVADMDPQPEDPTDWMTSVNWSDGGFDPVEAFGPLIPDFGTRVEIQNSTYGTNAPVIGPGDVAQAFEVRIGRANGAGLLTMTGGSLETANSCTVAPFTCNRRLRVGAADVELAEERMPGTFNLSGGTVTTDTLWIGSGSHGEMNMSGGVVNTRSNMYFDWSFDASSELKMTGGTINVGGILRMYRTSVLNLDGGEILIASAAELGTQNQLNPLFLQTPDVTVSITDGLLAANGFLQIGGSVVVDGGILRAGSFNESVSAGTIEINEGGTLQLNNSQESIANVQSLISSGFITTSSAQGTAGFVIEVVDVNGTNFTQVAFGAAGVPGDYNGDGTVDAADYTVFRDHQGANFDLMNENPAATTPGMVDQEDYNFWKSRFGNGGGSGADVRVAAVPEPAARQLGLLMLVGVVFIHCHARCLRQPENR